MSSISSIFCFRARRERSEPQVKRPRPVSSGRFDIDSANDSNHIGMDGVQDRSARGKGSTTSPTQRQSPPSKQNSRINEDTSINKRERSTIGTLNHTLSELGDRSNRGTSALPAPWAPVQLVRISSPNIIRAGGPTSSGTFIPTQVRSFNGFPPADLLESRTASPSKSNSSAVQPSSPPRQLSLLSRQLKSMTSFSPSPSPTRNQGARSESKRLGTAHSRRGSAYSIPSSTQTLSGPLETIMHLVDAQPFRPSSSPPKPALEPFRPSSSPKASAAIELGHLRIIKEDAPLSPDFQQVLSKSVPTVKEVEMAAADSLRELASRYAEKAIANGRPYYSIGVKPQSPFYRPLN